MSKRVATEIEKREFYNDVFTEFAYGNNPLTRLLGREMVIDISHEDAEAVIDRMMKTPLQISVMELLNDIVFKPSLTSLLSEDQEWLKVTKTANLSVVFRHFRPPPIEEGGWLGCKNTHPLMKPWASLYTKYEELVVGSSRNNSNLRTACEHNLPIDVVITHGCDASLSKKKPLLRFVIFEPLAENQKGCDLYVQDNPVKK